MSIAPTRPNPSWAGKRTSQRRDSLNQFLLTPGGYLDDVLIYPVDTSGRPETQHTAASDSVANEAIATGSAVVSVASTAGVSQPMMAIPIHRGRSVASVVVLVGPRDRADRTDRSDRSDLSDRADRSDRAVDHIAGVMEVWRPVGIYDEVALASGHYGGLDRFQNVSSFVRFEKGWGLPGQVWASHRGVVQNDLANHPGFLRAAGASADVLNMAIGIPVAADDFIATAVLISSHQSPIARGMEVWSLDTDVWELTGAAYHALGSDYPLKVGTRCDVDAGVMGLAVRHGRAVTTDDVDRLMSGRSAALAMPGPTSALAIPFFRGDRLTSVANLLF